MVCNQSRGMSESQIIFRSICLQGEKKLFFIHERSSRSFSSQEDCKLIIFEDISTCFSPSFSKLLHVVLRLILGRAECQINFFEIFRSPSIDEFGMTVKNVG